MGYLKREFLGRAWTETHSSRRPEPNPENKRRVGRQRGNYTSEQTCTPCRRNNILTTYLHYNNVIALCSEAYVIEQVVLGL